MRIIDTIPHPQFRISVFSMNDKYLVKFEAGPYEQTYKVAHDEVNGLDDLKSRVTEDFLNKVTERFRGMHAGNPWREA